MLGKSSRGYSLGVTQKPGFKSMFRPASLIAPSKSNIDPQEFPWIHLGLSCLSIVTASSLQTLLVVLGDIGRIPAGKTFAAGADPSYNTGDGGPKELGKVVLSLGDRPISYSPKIADDLKESYRS